MPTGALTAGSVLDSAPLHVAKVPDICATACPNHHQHPLIYRVDYDNQLPLAGFFNAFSHPRCRALLLSIVDDGTKGRVDVVSISPFACQTIKSIRFRVRAWIKIKVKLCIQFFVEVGWCKPIVFAIVAIARMVLILFRVQFALVDNKTATRSLHYAPPSFIIAACIAACSRACSLFTICSLRGSSM